MIVKNDEELTRLHAGGRKLSQILATLARAARPGVTTRALDTLARELIQAADGEPAFLNYRPAGAASPFPAALCVSINDEVVHGIPGDRQLKDGDLVGLDLGLKYQGLYTDMAVTVGVGEIAPSAQALLDVTRAALIAGIAAAKSGRKTGDIGFAIAKSVDKKQYDLVREFGGHGVGHRVHEPPEVPNVATRGTGVRLESGLVIAIEPMVTIGSAAIVTADDGWTIKTKSGALAAHFEHTVLVTDDGPEILTQ
ncbi:MAG: type I methionyl aminopeptidase [Patescibacteria group bacterium]